MFLILKAYKFKPRSTTETLKISWILHRTVLVSQNSSVYEFPLMVCTKLCELKCKVIHCVYYPGRNKRATMTKDHFLLLSCDATSVFIRQECFSSHIHNSTTYFVLYRHYITTTTIPFSQKQAIPIVVASLVKNTLDGYGLFW